MGPVAVTGRRHQQHRKSNAHSMINREAERAGARTRQNSRYVLRLAVRRYLQGRRERVGKYVGPCDCKRADMPIGSNICVAHALVALAEQYPPRRGLLLKYRCCFFRATPAALVSISASASMCTGVPSITLVRS